MFSITVIASFHTNSGKCNSDELIKLIETFQPEVIFEELDFESFNGIYSDGELPNSNEAKAVSSYLKKYPIDHVPVDTYQFNYSDSFSGADEISRRNPDYKNLWYEHYSNINKQGYPYINSNECFQIVEMLKNMEKSTLVEMNDLNLLASYHNEQAIYEEREYVILKNIYDYCKQTQFNKGLLICGVIHISGLNHKIQEFESKEKIKINWNFFNSTRT